MQFWNQMSRTLGSDVVKPTTSIRTNAPMKGSRPLFSPTIPGVELGEERTSQVPTVSMPAVDPTDKSVGGMDRPTQNKPGTVFPPYTVTNGTIDRTYDANASSVGELADVLYSLLKDLKVQLNNIDRRLKSGGL